LPDLDASSSYGSLEPTRRATDISTPLAEHPAHRGRSGERRHRRPRRGCSRGRLRAYLARIQALRREDGAGRPAEDVCRGALAGMPGRWRLPRPGLVPHRRARSAATARRPGRARTVRMPCPNMT
jgi:hypothetical protein